MLNEKQKLILEYIRSICKGDVFKVIDADDVMEAVEGIEKPELLEIVKQLAEREYITFKFATLDSYCIKASNKAIIEEEKTAIVAKRILEETVADGGVQGASKKVVFIAALLGGLVGGLIAGIIQLIISQVV